MLVFIHFNFLAYNGLQLIAPSILNIKEQGLAHCIPWGELSYDKFFGVLFPCHMENSKALLFKNILS